MTTPFTDIRSKLPSAISQNSKFTIFWAQMKNFKDENGQKQFSLIATIASRFYVISATEDDAERAFSKIKWRFYDRRTCVKQETMIKELHIESYQRKKIESESDLTVTMWEHPQNKK